MKRDRKQGLGLAVGLAVLTIVLVTTDDRADGLRPTQPMHDPKMPDPPRQSQTWTPPKSALPRFLVKATATLFEQGMPDPRGCEYRSVELAGESDLYKNPATPRPVTHAWVLPGEANGPRYAVAWNGLIYPLTAIGDAADLEADVRAIVAAVARAHAEHDARAKQTLTAPWRSGWSYLYDASVGNLQTASQEGLTPLKVCFLLRLGRADLAEILWEAGTGQKPQGEQRDLTPYGVSYLTLASDWTWALFDRAVDAHSRADDLLALTSAWEVARIRPIIEAKAEAMGFPRRQGFVQAGSSPSYLDFLKELPALLADQERRAREPKREPQRLAVIEKIPDPSKRIAALIDRLDEMGMRDSMGFRPQSDENVKALIREGNGAINPLLDTLEHDERLTRSYSSDERHRTRFRHLVPVYATAYSALVEIIGTSLFRPDSYATIFVNEGPEKRQEMAATIRTYVERFRGLSTEERSYRILADDRASSRQWLEAASQLSAPVKPVVVRVLDPRRPFGRPRVHYGEKVALHGDGLRNQKAPSVTELMVRRLDDLARPDYPWKQGDASPLYTACELALDLARWDSAAARPALKSLVDRCLREISGETQSRISYDPGSLGDFVARITDARSQLGDLDGLNAYAAWLRTISPDKMTYHIDSIFVPMEDNPHHSATAATAEWLFNDPASPWSTLQGDPKKPNDWYVHDRLIGRPMIGVAGFRRSLLRALNDRSEFGKASLKEGALVYQLKSGGSGSGGLTYIDPDGPRSTPETSVRFCDYYAWRLTTAFDGIPTCMLYWPEDRRDRAIAAQAAFLKQLGERFDASPLYDEVPGRLGFHRIPPVFPTMDHPATAEDVRRGAAIFSLKGLGQVRMIKLPSRPLAAKWVKLTDYAFLQQYFEMKTGKNETRITYDQDGLVWQAEEMLEGGRWRRYYGFVGRRVDRVPAEEIEFPEEWYRWGRLSQQLDCRVDLPPAPADKDPTTSFEFEANRPLVVTVRLRNRSGLEKTVPAEYQRGDQRPGMTLRPGVELKLYRAGEGPPRWTAGSQGPQPDWQELHTRAIARFTPGPATRSLGAADSFDAFHVDLNALFAMTQPGDYRLLVSFTKESGVAEGDSNEVRFRIVERP